VNLYHGTSEVVASALSSRPSEVSVDKGGGELGRGFYAGDNVALAASWANGRFPSHPGVLEINVSTSDYVRLRILTLKQEEVIANWKKLILRKETRVFTFGCDVVYAPFASYPAWQHKFESSEAEILLRRSNWRIV
jgi:hypothetical protein